TPPTPSRSRAVAAVIPSPVCPARTLVAALVARARRPQRARPARMEAPARAHPQQRGLITTIITRRPLQAVTKVAVLSSLNCCNSIKLQGQLPRQPPLSAPRRDVVEADQGHCPRANRMPSFGVYGVAAVRAIRATGLTLLLFVAVYGLNPNSATPESRGKARQLTGRSQSP
ncbi:MAG: hypothetical protein JWO52_4476, partial [Gammaproteobacteria bacterium]|nr:hypothetical protein [Gammaproteobacteria bacterium]